MRKVRRSHGCSTHGTGRAALRHAIGCQGWQEKKGREVTLCKVKGGGSVGMEEVKGLLDIRRVMRSHCRWDLRNRIREVV